jgi:alpha-L-rhamnosidase
VLPSGATHEVGSGRHSWVEHLPRQERRRGSLSLDSDLTEVIDDPQAYGAVLDAIHALDPDRAEAFRSSTRWTRGRPLREPLNKAPLDVLDAVQKALAALTGE